MFRPYKVIIRPSKKTYPRAVLCFTALWDPKRLQVLTWQRLMFRSYGGPTHGYVTSPQDRYLTSHRYSARPTRLPSPTAEPAPEALLTRSEFPFVVTSIQCYNRHVWSYSFFFSSAPEACSRGYSHSLQGWIVTTSNAGGPKRCLELMSVLEFSWLYLVPHRPGNIILILSIHNTCKDQMFYYNWVIPGDMFRR